jgi:hypothetical protein
MTENQRIKLNEKEKFHSSEISLELEAGYDKKHATDML